MLGVGRRHNPPLCLPWALATGSSTSVGHITAVFTPANDEPDPDPDPDPVPAAVWAHVYNGTTWQPLGHPTLTT